MISFGPTFADASQRLAPTRKEPSAWNAEEESRGGDSGGRLGQGIVRHPLDHEP